LVTKALGKLLAPGLAMADQGQNDKMCHPENQKMSIPWGGSARKELRNIKPEKTLRGATREA
jgi:hypothetical protein